MSRILIAGVLLSTLFAGQAFADDFPAVVESRPTQMGVTKDDKPASVDEYKTVPVRYLLETPVITPVLPAERTVIER